MAILSVHLAIFNCLCLFLVNCWFNSKFRRTCLSTKPPDSTSLTVLNRFFSVINLFYQYKKFTEGLLSESCMNLAELCIYATLVFTCKYQVNTTLQELYTFLYICYLDISRFVLVFLNNRK